MMTAQTAHRTAVRLRVRLELCLKSVNLYSHAPPLGDPKVKRSGRAIFQDRIRDEDVGVPGGGEEPLHTNSTRYAPTSDIVSGATNRQLIDNRRQRLDAQNAVMSSSTCCRFVLLAGSAFMPISHLFVYTDRYKKPLHRVPGA